MQQIAIHTVSNSHESWFDNSVAAERNPKTLDYDLVYLGFQMAHLGLRKRNVNPRGCWSQMHRRISHCMSASVWMPSSAYVRI